MSDSEEDYYDDDSPAPEAPEPPEDDEEDELDAFMSSIEKQAAHDKQESEDKAKKVEETGDIGNHPSNRVDLDAEDEADEFVLNYDPSKIYGGEEEEDIDDFALADTAAGRDEEGNIIYKGSRKSVNIPPPSESASESTSETPSTSVPEVKKEEKKEVKPQLSEKEIRAQEKRATNRYNRWGFTKGNSDSMVPAPPPPSNFAPPPPFSSFPPPPPPSSFPPPPPLIPPETQPVKKKSRFSD
ncbi:hypothetical protein FO519_009407 [Halicephalobus sp. NKZ332]|nr:hypothetical protein FO519_009407 [Halicephalobus sp. NKZ332]